MDTNAEEKIHVQDDVREKLIATHCRINRDTKSRVGRDGWLTVDAVDRTIEMKSSTVANFSTGRNIGLESIAKWYHQYWVIAWGRLLRTGFQMEELYICHPNDLKQDIQKWENWISQRLELTQKAHDLLNQHHAGAFDEGQLKQLKWLFGRGCKRNSADISMKLVRLNGTPLSVMDGDLAHSQIVEFIRKYPLDAPKQFQLIEPKVRKPKKARRMSVKQVSVLPSVFDW